MIDGNGLNAKFWTYDWMGMGSLKETFPRIFALAIVKQGLVANFGSSNQRVRIRRFFS